MPLDTPHRQGLVDDRLHRAVYGPLDRPQSLPQPVCRLMMGAVHHQGLSEKVLQGRGGCPYPVEPVPTRRLAVAGQVLDQRASENTFSTCSPRQIPRTGFFSIMNCSSRNSSPASRSGSSPRLAVFAWP